MIPYAENNRTDQNIQTELENFMAETENDEIERQEPAVAEIVGKAIFSQKYDEYAFSTSQRSGSSQRSSRS